jgi:uncharacterized protein (DUF1499 family)
MKKFLKGAMITALSLAAFVIVALIALSVVSRSGGSQGLLQGKLQPCKLLQNCVCTEAYDNKNAEPVMISGIEADAAWELMRNAVKSTGGRIETDDGKYLWATYKTPVFRFVDDFEARLDEQKAVIHLRSASRVGHSDLGTNKKRINNIIEKFTAGKTQR